MLWTAVLSVFVLTLAVRTFFPHKATAKKPVASKRGNAKKGGSTPVGRIAWPAASFLVVALGMGWLVWNKSNFKAEKVMQYDFMARFQQWNRILETINNITRTAPPVFYPMWIPTPPVRCPPPRPSTSWA